MSDAPTTEERYQRAINSSNLTVVERRRGDVDMLIAAGWTAEGLATMLYRLRVEFDTVDRMELQQAANSETARLLVLMRLKTLPAARDGLGAFAEQRAVFKNLQIQPAELKAIVAKVLDIFLAPLCTHCEGRGFSGGYGSPKVWCTKCSRSGRRPLRFGQTDEERFFARDLLGIMDRKLAHMDAMMRRFLRDRADMHS